MIARFVSVPVNPVIFGEVTVRLATVAIVAADGVTAMLLAVNLSASPIDRLKPLIVRLSAPVGFAPPKS